MRLVMHNPRKGKPVLTRTKSGRKLVAERLAERERLAVREAAIISRGETISRKRADANRPTANPPSREIFAPEWSAAKAKAAPHVTRPTAKTAARKAFENWYGGAAILAYAGEDNCGVVNREAFWPTWQAAWRTARGTKPTTREGAT